MPTGYTSDIAEGISFEKFVMNCAKAFGAAVMMRDEPMDAEIPEFKPSDYHSKEIAGAKAKLKELKKMKTKEAERKAEMEYHQKVVAQEKNIIKNNKLAVKYKDMLAKVKAWQPPSPDHKGLKDFMIEQIETSIKYDCNNSYYLDNPPVLLSGKDWLTKEFAEALRNIDYHTKENTAEIERTNGRNLWVKQLRESL